MLFAISGIWFSLFNSSLLLTYESWFSDLYLMIITFKLESSGISTNLNINLDLFQYLYITGSFPDFPWLCPMTREASLETLPNVNIRDPSHDKNLLPFMFIVVDASIGYLFWFLVLVLSVWCWYRYLVLALVSDMQIDFWCWC